MMLRYELKLPDFEIDQSPTFVSLWLAKEGCAVSQDQPLIEIAVGSVVIDLPSPVDGVLAEKKVATDESLQVGQTLAVIEQVLDL